jgi:ribosome-binding factor A
MKEARSKKPESGIRWLSLPPRPLPSGSWLLASGFFGAPMDERRALRVSEAVREELAAIIGFESDDPRLLAVEVTEVHLSSDGRHASIRVAIRGSERDQLQSMAALDHARHYLRRELASRLTLHHVPELHFQHDRDPDVESRIDFLLKRAKKSRGRTENQA